MRTFDWENMQLREMFNDIAARSMKLLGRPVPTPETAEPIAALARRLLSNRGEASGVALAISVLRAWQAMPAKGRVDWFKTLASDFGPDEALLGAAVDAWRANPSSEAASRLASASEPLRQELFRRINLAPGGTSALVAMREELLGFLREEPELEVVDHDFVHLFNSWFNRGFLMLKRIDWNSPAQLLEKIIRYEAVHAIQDWDDLRRRVQPLDRRCYAFIHPQMPEEPLIFVEVALTTGIPRRIDVLLAEERPPLAPSSADTAAFYSISNTQRGLKGVSFGNFLIKQVVEDLLQDLPNLRTFVTLSPVPGFASWVTQQKNGENAALVHLSHLIAQPGWETDGRHRARAAPLLAQAAASYLAGAKDQHGRPLDPVARFHLGNGARLEQINLEADPSSKGRRQSHSVMVNYLYDLPSIEANHEAYSTGGHVATSRSVRKLMDDDTARLVLAIS